MADITVNLTFIDHEGSRATVPGRIGQTISDVAEMHGIDIGPTAGGGVRERENSEVWSEDLFGEGATLGYDHVQLPPVWLAKAPRRRPFFPSFPPGRAAADRRCRRGPSGSSSSWRPTGTTTISRPRRASAPRSR